jgi:hypothetical protein
MEVVTKPSVRIREISLPRWLVKARTPNPEVVKKLENKLLSSERIKKIVRKTKGIFPFRKDGKSYLRVEYA